jgi:signal transduction histidine kinase
MKNKSEKKARIPWVAILLILFAIISVIIATVAQMKSSQADEAIVPEVKFVGEYRIDGGEWKTVSRGKHVSAANGIVELKGRFILYEKESGTELGAASDGVIISLYLDHIKATVKDSNGRIWVSDNENDLYGKGACTAMWTEYVFEENAGEEVLITVYNPHAFGNAKAVDSLLKNLSVYNAGTRSGIFSSLAPIPLSVGILLALFLLVLLGASIFASLLHQKNSRQIWLLWLLVFFGGAYFIFSQDKIGIWNPMHASNTVMLGASMMAYVLTAYAIITSFLRGILKKISIAGAAFLGAVTVILLAVFALTPVDLYDTYPYWTAAAVIGALILLVCVVISIFKGGKKEAQNGEERLVYIAFTVLLTALISDALATALGVWQGGVISFAVLLAIVLVSFVIICRVLPRSVRTILEAKNIEAEKQAMEIKLQESHISIMLSQIQPHFLYNTLNSIYYLCETNPMLAKSMVNSFSEYLRNNLSSIEEKGLVSFETELSHIKTYLEIEKVRFEDTLEIEYDIKCVDFSLPVLTVQPIVENAVKHGTSKKRGGGKVVISTYEEKENYVITVSDTGCGFDPSKKKDDGKRHVGIENVRQRLLNMCGGTLTIESEIGVGTSATIKIPKGE